MESVENDNWCQIHILTLEASVCNNGKYSYLLRNVGTLSAAT